MGRPGNEANGVLHLLWYPGFPIVQFLITCSMQTWTCQFNVYQHGGYKEWRGPLDIHVRVPSNLVLRVLSYMTSLTQTVQVELMEFEDEEDCLLAVGCTIVRR